MTESSRRYAELLAEPVDEARLLHNLRGVRQQQERRRVLRARVVASLATVAVGALLLVVGGRYLAPEGARPGPLGARDASEFEQLSGGISDLPARIVFVDGSRIHKGPASRLELLENTGERFRTALRAGWARFEVKPGGPRRWIVDAGLAEIEVVGTAFTVSRSATHTRVRVHHGRVLVRGLLVPDGIVQLTAGQVLDVAPPVFGPRAPAEAPHSVEVEPGPAAQPELTPADAARALARADALRRQNKPARAADELARELLARPRGRDAGLVALTLAQLELDDLERPAQAAHHFERALAAPWLPSSLREQATARRVEALARAGNASAASEAAKEYLRRHPNGSWSRAVRGWAIMGEPRRAP